MQYPEHDVYRTVIDRKLMSASTVVVSALLPATREVFPGQSGGDGWLGMTVRVRSGARVTITDLFRSPDRGLRVLASAWKARIPRIGGRSCAEVYREVYAPTARNYGAFALTPTGLAVGASEVASCYRLVATVPYGLLRPHLSRLGQTLVDGVRAPRGYRAARRRRLDAA